MKTIEQLTNIDKAKIIFDLFKEEIPEFLKYLQSMAEKIAHDKDELIANWSNPFLSYHQWLNLAEQVSATVKRYGKNLEKSSNLDIPLHSIPVIPLQKGPVIPLQKGPVKR
ncbi:hypothetical protein [Mucilaginibacter sp.]|uniref:hypothetical protein n=1 Tax=Mucilaginibacter sp. TaxID=1882438 RepID=UPI003265E9E4